METAENSTSRHNSWTSTLVGDRHCHDKNVRQRKIWTMTYGTKVHNIHRYSLLKGSSKRHEWLCPLSLFQREYSLETVGLSVSILKRNDGKVPDQLGPTAVDWQEFFLSDPNHLSIYPHVNLICVWPCIINVGKVK